MSPNRQFAADVVDRLSNAGFAALWAGGCVRDELLGQTPKDYDVATDARPEQVRELFGRKRTLAVGESFGVIVVLGPKGAGQIEVATFRSDGEYLDGRRPESVQFCSAEEDARRRDFTINGMFYDPLKQQVLDYVGGRSDLEAGIVRAIGDPRARMKEDKLRMLRAVRFTATFDFELDHATADAVRSMADQIDAVSAERISHELRRMLAHTNRARALQLCHDVNLLTQVLPELDDVSSDPDAWKALLSLLARSGGSGTGGDIAFPLAFAALLSPVVVCRNLDVTAAAQLTEEVGKRLKLSNREIQHAAWLLRHRESLRDADQLSAAQLKRVLAQGHARDLLFLIRASDEAHHRTPKDANFCEAFLRNTSTIELDPPALISGSELIRAGLIPGPRFKEILETVRDAQLNGEVTTTEHALKLAQTILESA
jgi:poly(A) polymerase